MATYYWVGGNGNWNDYDGFNWSLTSGGAGGAGVPTFADDVVFNASSGSGIVAIGYLGPPSCRNLTASAVTVNTTFNSDYTPITVYGTLNIGANAIVNSVPVNIIFKGATTGKTVTISNTSFINSLVYDEVGGGWTQGASTVGAIAVTNGSLTFSGIITTPSLTVNGGTLITGAFSHNNYNAFVTSSGGSVVASSGTVNFTGSTFKLGTNALANDFTFNEFTVASGVTFTGTPNVTMGVTTASSSSNNYFNGAGKTYGTFNIFGGQNEITGANSFTAFNCTGIDSQGSYLSVDSNQTVTGAFTVQGNSAAVYRMSVTSNLSGTARTFTLSGATAGTKIVKWVNLTDITITNSGAALTPTLVGDCLGNTVPAGTFPAAISCYAKTAGSNFTYSNTALWYTTSGGATSISSVGGRVAPLPQDNVFFDANTGVGTISVDVPVMGTNLDFTNWNAGAGTFSGATISPVAILGTITSPGPAFTNLQTVCFSTRTTSTFTPPSGIRNFYFNNPGATITLGSTFPSSTFLNLYFCAGTFSTNNINITALKVDFNQPLVGPACGAATSANTINLGSSVVTLTSSSASTTLWRTTATTTVNAGTSKIKLTGYSGGYSSTTTRTFVGSGQTYYDLEFANTNLAVTSVYAYMDVGGCTFNSWLNSNTVATHIALKAGLTTTIGTLNFTGSKGAGLIISNVGGYSESIPSTGNKQTQATISLSNNSTTTYTAFVGINKTGAGTLTAKNVANLGNNTGITFPALTRTYVFTGNVGSANAGSFTVPGNFAGSCALIAIGGGGTGYFVTSTGSPGGGAGGLSISSNINISTLQTLYYTAGLGGVAPSSSGTGVNGGNSWINTANLQPGNETVGASATGGTGSSSTYNTPGNGGGGYSNGLGNRGSLTYIGGSGGAGGGASPGAGGGSAPSLLYHYGLDGAAATSNTLGLAYGGGGGGGQKTVGATTSSTTGGAGGQDLSGTAAAGGTSGVAGTAGTLGGGGGGGGTSAAGGAAGYNNEFTYVKLNGTLVDGTIGPSGGGGGGGQSITGAGGAGGTASIGGGGGGGGRGTTPAGTGKSGDGGVGMVVFIFEYYPAVSQATFIG